MKKIKNISLVLVLLIAVFIMVNYTKIISFALSIDYPDLKVNTLYEKNDEIVLFSHNGFGSGSGYADGIYNAVIMYYNEANELEYAYYFDHYYADKPVIYVGLTYQEIEDLNVNTDSSISGIDIYTDGKENLVNVDSWLLTNVDTKKFEDVCRSENKIQEFEACRNILNGNGSDYYKEASVLIFKEYKVPQFSLECNPRELSYLDETYCEFKVNTKVPIKEIKTNLKSEHLELFETKKTDGWSFTLDEDDVYTITPDETFTGEGTVLGFTMKAIQDITVNTTINLTNINYTDEYGNNVAVDVWSDIKINKKEEIKNPVTSSNSTYMVALIIIAMISLDIAVKAFRKIKH